MTGAPEYFERIRTSASQRWDVLEKDPELAGPWQQLFRQVQNPRHVLSELLQNADDAEATQASAWIEDDVFVFEHDGVDFSETDFASLCRFGCSNKTTLHTIGFRGIGFKSTFSLGDCVELTTPSLSVQFHRARFTEPCWVATSADAPSVTTVRVRIADTHRRQAILDNLKAWCDSPASLLFFKRLRSLTLQDRRVHWTKAGEGPVPESEWMALDTEPESRLLLIRSAPETFPVEAFAEIKQERNMASSDDGRTEPPSCALELLLDCKAEGEIYVVLPTGVKTKLPFACNAPFVQDPARLRIKDPDTSPTNRWLLERAGRLAASTLLRWLSRRNRPLHERATAYDLFPDVDRETNTLEGRSGTFVELAFEDAIADSSLLLAEGGKLVRRGKSIIVPPVVHHVWTPEQASRLLDAESRPPLCQHVSSSNRKKLTNWGIVDRLGEQELLQALLTHQPPKPRTWKQLLLLWKAISEPILGTRSVLDPKALHVIPVRGTDMLQSAADVVRLGAAKCVGSPADWTFLADHLHVLDSGWVEFVEEGRKQGDSDSGRAASILEKVELQMASIASRIIDKAACSLAAKKAQTVAACVRLAQIAAKLKAKVSDNFRFVTRELHLVAPGKGLLYDRDGTLAEWIPEDRRTSHLLHDAYGEYRSCTREEWDAWVLCGDAGLLTFVPRKLQQREFYGREKAEKEAGARCFRGRCSYWYVTNLFRLEDSDFEPFYWTHWRGLAATDERFWVKLVDRLFQAQRTAWARTEWAKILQIATTGRTYDVTSEPLAPSWILQLRGLPCLPDTRGVPRRPGDLLRRTPQTEPFLEVEPFVDALLDSEATRPLLELLGVRSTPTGPDRVLDCLRALSKSDRPPVLEVDKWYRRLDQMLATCSTPDHQRIAQAFQSERLVLALGGTWGTSLSVFRSMNEEDVPGAAVVRASVQELSLWGKVGMAERPTAELAIAWLRTLESGRSLVQDDARRVRSLLGRHALRVWQECHHWINMSGEWSDVDRLEYSITMQSLVRWEHLHEWVKQKTADFRCLPATISSLPVLATLAPLAACLEERPSHQAGRVSRPSDREWLQTLSALLQRVRCGSEDETVRVQAQAAQLAATRWVDVDEIEVVPYLEGTPAGTPRNGDVVWSDHVLYATPLTTARLARRVPEEIGKVFGRPDIQAALAYSFERTSQDIRSYVEGNFDLVSETAATPCGTGTCADSETGSVPTDSPKPGNDDSALQDDENKGPVTPDGVAPAQGADPATGSPITPPVAPPPPGDRLPAEGKPQRPALIERFAQAHGFLTAGEGRFERSDGSWVGRSLDDPRIWEHRASSGDLLRVYWPKEHCLARDALEIGADLWSLLDNRPELYAIVVVDTDGRPVEFRGVQLRTLRDERKIELFPATYRLVMRQ